MSKARRRIKRRERPLGMAIALGLVASVSIGLVIFLLAMMIPGTAVQNLFGLIAHDSSATLAFDPLYQQLVYNVNRDEALFYEPLALLCGGLTLGLLAPRYAGTRRVLWAAAGMSAGLLIVSLAFTWIAGVYQAHLLAEHEGGLVARKTAPLDYILNALGWHLSWIAICILGAWGGLRFRNRRLPHDPEPLAAERVLT